jgi:hypothetical protein
VDGNKNRFIEKIYKEKDMSIKEQRIKRKGEIMEKIINYTNCDFCNKKNVCKYKDSLDDISQYLIKWSEIIEKSNLPFSINIKCSESITGSYVLR